MHANSNYNHDRSCVCQSSSVAEAHIRHQLFYPADCVPRLLLHTDLFHTTLEAMREIKLIYLQSCATPSFGETLDRVICVRSHLYLDFANASHAELKKLSAPCGSRDFGVHMCHALAQHLPIETALHPES